MRVSLCHIKIWYIRLCPFSTNRNARSMQGRLLSLSQSHNRQVHWLVPMVTRMWSAIRFLHIRCIYRYLHCICKVFSVDLTFCLPSILTASHVSTDTGMRGSQGTASLRSTIPAEEVWWCGVSYPTPENLNWCTFPATLAPLDTEIRFWHHTCCQQWTSVGKVFSTTLDHT